MPLWFISHWCFNCKNSLILCPLRSNQFMRAGYLSLDQIHYGQSNPAGHLATLRGPQAFTVKWGDASCFNAQSHRNQWGISLTHYSTRMPCGIKREVQNAVEQIFFFSSKHKWSVVVFNLLLCWADNAWPQARTLAYSHTICSSMCVWMQRHRKCIHQQFQVYGEKQNGLFLP